MSVPVPSWVSTTAWLIWKPDPTVIFQPGRVVRSAETGQTFLLPTLPGQPEVAKYALVECRPATVDDLPRCQHLIVGGDRIDVFWRPGLVTLAQAGQVRHVRLPEGAAPVPAPRPAPTPPIDDAVRAFAAMFNGAVVPADEIDPRFLEECP